MRVLEEPQVSGLSSVHTVSNIMNPVNQTDGRTLLTSAVGEDGGSLGGRDKDAPECLSAPFLGMANALLRYYCE